MTRADLLQFKDCLTTTPQGLYCKPGDFWIDPKKPVPRAVISHGHSDHACRGHGSVLASPETLAIMKSRMGSNFADHIQSYHEPLQIDDVQVALKPAGHILGSMQICMKWRGRQLVFSGDYKRSFDPTCAGFELMRCDLFITEATFALPVFKHEKADHEIARLIASLNRNPDRTHVLGAYSLGKAQRVIAVLRAQGYDLPVYVHGEAMRHLCQLYEDFGVRLGDVRFFTESHKDAREGQLIICPPQLLNEAWMRHLDNPLTCFASGWMRLRGRARQRGVEFPMVISDHCDWPELLQSVSETGAEEVWVTHGREDALVYQLGRMGLKAKALALIDADDEEL